MVEMIEGTPEPVLCGVCEQKHLPGECKVKAEKVDVGLEMAHYGNTTDARVDELAKLEAILPEVLRRTEGMAGHAAITAVKNYMAARLEELIGGAKPNKPAGSPGSAEESG